MGELSPDALLSNGENSERSDSDRTFPYCITLGTVHCAEVRLFLAALLISDDAQSAQLSYVPDYQPW